jgi:hypothetical protein
VPGSANVFSTILAGAETILGIPVAVLTILKNMLDTSNKFMKVT